MTIYFLYPKLEDVVNIYQKLAVATAGVALSFAAIEAKPAQAAILTYNYTEKPFKSEPYVEGSFSFNNSAGGKTFKVTNFTLDWFSSDGSPLAFFPNPNPFGFAPPSSVPVWNSSMRSLVGEYQQCGRVCTNSFFKKGQTNDKLFFNGITVASTSGSVRYTDPPSNGITPGSTDDSVSYTEAPEPSGVAGFLIVSVGLILKKKGNNSAQSTWL